MSLTLSQAPNPGSPGVTLNQSFLVTFQKRALYFREIKDPGKTFRAVGVDLYTRPHTGSQACPTSSLPVPTSIPLIPVGVLFSVSLDSIHPHSPVFALINSRMEIVLLPLPRNPALKANSAQQSGWQGDKLSFFQLPRKGPAISWTRSLE